MFGLLVAIFGASAVAYACLPIAFDLIESGELFLGCLVIGLVFVVSYLWGGFVGWLLP